MARKTLKRLGWFAAIWLASVLCVLAVAALIRLAVAP